MQAQRNPRQLTPSLRGKAGARGCLGPSTGMISRDGRRSCSGTTWVDTCATGSRPERELGEPASPVPVLRSRHAEAVPASIRIGSGHLCAAIGFSAGGATTVCTAGSAIAVG
jgi:hypothetical protein